MSLPVILYITSFEIATHFIIMLVVWIDMLTTPLLIEVSYLACNKRNLNTLFSFGTLLEILMYLRLKSSRRVEPAPMQLYKNYVFYQCISF
ncbi:hypothetical protein CAEBREN_08577 [Caenorhabditis brenneri]|uniref:Uncharacterized protein n=1 Tax=Caenorhabditis brenneri TaxID=135651 RepID=G0N5Y8_CAEBE|nr:hypothetical protein CAEBREN_08577 [Caenorhabditis brenneri]